MSTAIHVAPVFMRESSDGQPGGPCHWLSTGSPLLLLCRGWGMLLHKSTKCLQEINMPLTCLPCLHAGEKVSYNYKYQLPTSLPRFSKITAG